MATVFLTKQHSTLGWLSSPEVCPWLCKSPGESSPRHRGSLCRAVFSNLFALTSMTQSPTMFDHLGQTDRKTVSSAHFGARGLGHSRRLVPLFWAPTPASAGYSHTVFINSRVVSGIKQGQGLTSRLRQHIAFHSAWRTLLA